MITIADNEICVHKLCIVCHTQKKGDRAMVS